jgi:hypothetical protein
VRLQNGRKLCSMYFFTLLNMTELDHSPLCVGWLPYFVTYVPAYIMVSTLHCIGDNYHSTGNHSVPYSFYSRARGANKIFRRHRTPNHHKRSTASSRLSTPPGRRISLLGYAAASFCMRTPIFFAKIFPSQRRTKQSLLQ